MWRHLSRAGAGLGSLGAILLASEGVFGGLEACLFGAGGSFGRISAHLTSTVGPLGPRRRPLLIADGSLGSRRRHLLMRDGSLGSLGKRLFAAKLRVGKPAALGLALQNLCGGLDRRPELADKRLGDGLGAVKPVRAGGAHIVDRRDVLLNGFVNLSG